MGAYVVYSLESWGWVYRGTWHIHSGANTYAYQYAAKHRRVVKVLCKDSRKEVYRVSPDELITSTQDKPYMPTPFQTFYIIWSPTGPTPPKAQHYSREEADRVCQSMAGRHPRQEFYVMEAKARAKVNNVEFVEASGEQDYHPF